MPRYILMQYIQNLRTDNTGITQNNRKLTLWPCQRKKVDESSLTFVGVLMSRGGALLTVSLPRAWWLNMDAIGVELLLRASSSADSISLSLRESNLSTSLIY
mmetsp:Transcript_10496/g.18966  ORF Transcript_10496/g.18966 Transcript_10496/m.18966 type:complete len:102 (-) Transcript_10496:755-1060(-)